jgi:hypothetical protein
MPAVPAAAAVSQVAAPSVAAFPVAAFPVAAAVTWWLLLLLLLFPPLLLLHGGCSFCGCRSRSCCCYTVSAPSVAAVPAAAAVIQVAAPSVAAVPAAAAVTQLLLLLWLLFPRLLRPRTPYPLPPHKYCKQYAYSVFTQGRRES